MSKNPVDINDEAPAEAAATARRLEALEELCKLARQGVFDELLDKRN
jgi:hypothetical protein